MLIPLLSEQGKAGEQANEHIGALLVKLVLNRADVSGLRQTSLRGRYVCCQLEAVAPRPSLPPYVSRRLRNF